MNDRRDDFVARYPFPLDRFQTEAIDALDRGEHVVVAVPTGSGKTVVAEYGIETARRAGRRAFYTAPIKALSNQKYHDLVAVHGTERVGLLTGDNVINGDAPIIVMTTEVLRNMIYESSDALTQLGVVILDEVHYLADRHRGSVWEEVIIHLRGRAARVSERDDRQSRGVHRLGTSSEGRHVTRRRIPSSRATDVALHVA